VDALAGQAWLTLGVLGAVLVTPIATGAGTELVMFGGLPSSSPGFSQRRRRSPAARERRHVRRRAASLRPAALGGRGANAHAAARVLPLDARERHMLLTEVLSNTTSVVLAFPIALATAKNLGGALNDLVQAVTSIVAPLAFPFTKR
jgi:hypothetical protein